MPILLILFRSSAILAFSSIRSTSYLWDNCINHSSVTLYRHAAETVSLPTRIISGWDNYFSDEYTLYFIFAAVFLLVCTVYIPERADGIYPLIRCTKKGGGATAAVAALTRDYLFTFLGAAAFTAASIIMRTASYDSLNAPGRLFNIFSLGNCGGLFERYLAVNVGGRLVPLAMFGICVLTPAVALCTAAAFSAPAFTDAGICGRILKKYAAYVPAGRKSAVSHCGICSFCSTRLTKR